VEGPVELGGDVAKFKALRLSSITAILSKEIA
jgi:hypothetical protein